MAQVYKLFDTAKDIKETRTLLHENIPITGSLLSGTYSDANIKNYTHGKFQSVYDYPYLSSSANHIFDITVGLASDSGLSGSGASFVESKEKVLMYNQMAQVLAGYDIDGNILQFDQDGDLLATSGQVKLKECVFLTFSRLLAKDEIKKQTVNITLGTASYADPFSDTLLISDYGAANEYRVNSPAGEYGILYTGSTPVEGTGVGLVYYQAGVIVLTASVFDGGSTFSSTEDVDGAFSGSSIQDLCDTVRHRIQNIQFNNTVELNSRIYFCRIEPDDFNYSSNPTYLSESQIVIKDDEDDDSVSYITTVGLYSSDNELLAVAKLSEPLKKTPSNSLILRTRLDF